MNRPDFIKNYQNHIDDDNAHYPDSSELFSIGSPIGKLCGLQKIGLHVETLPPGRRTSWPHAEKEEEEFVFVIEGNPQAWINGDIYDLSPGDLVAFPAGTGIAHTIINNSENNALLLVGGEATKPENKIFYSHHPKRNQEMKDKGIYWDNPPKHKQGSHDGQPNKTQK